VDSDNQGGPEGPSEVSGVEAPRSTPRARGLPRDTIIILVAAVALVAAVLGVLVGHLAFKSSPRSTTSTTVINGSTTTTRAQNSCPPWPQYVDTTLAGPLALRDAKPSTGVYVWRTLNGWNLRLVNITDAVSGSVLGGNSTTMHAALDPGSAGTVKDQANVITFDFPAHTATATDGITFTLSFGGCGTSTLVFSLQSARELVPIHLIFVGDRGAHPVSNPFGLARQTSN
jgi:hypothetical protein